MTDKDTSGPALLPNPTENDDIERIFITSIEEAIRSFEGMAAITSTMIRIDYHEG